MSACVYYILTATAAAFFYCENRQLSYPPDRRRRPMQFLFTFGQGKERERESKQERTNENPTGESFLQV